MEEKGLVRREVGAEMMERVVIQDDLTALTAKQRVEYYAALCQSLGLNPLTKPFAYIVQNGRLCLYAKKDCTDQIRDNRGISIQIVSREVVEGVYVVTARGTDKGGRSDESIGAVAIDALKDDARANALMKAETKAKRRVTLSLGGLGWLDETEIETIPDAKAVKVSVETGEIEAQAVPVAPAPPAEAVDDAQYDHTEAGAEYDAAGARERVAEKRAARVEASTEPPKVAPKISAKTAPGFPGERARQLLAELDDAAAERGMSPEAYRAIREKLATAALTEKRMQDAIAEAKRWEPPVPKQASLDEGPEPEEEE